LKTLEITYKKGGLKCPKQNETIKINFMKLTTQGFYRVSVYMKDNKKEFKQYYVAADSIQEATVIVENKLKEGNISDNLYINSILNTGQCLIRKTEKEAELPLKNKDVTERIKTFEDAYNELGSNHLLCKEWDSFYHGNENDACEDIKDVIAYYKLRIITAALNEGWKPKFTKDEYKYYPYYCFYTKQEYDTLSDEEKKTCRAVGSASSNPKEVGHPVHTLSYCAYCTAALSGSDAGMRLTFKNCELAEYAGQQFIDIYADFLA